MGLIEDIGRGPVALDTSVFIYFIERHARFHRLIRPLFEAMDAGKLQAVTSAVTLLEVLVHPFRSGDPALAGRYEELLTDCEGLFLVEARLPLLRSAARIRAATRAKIPDALQIAAAVASGCPCLLTNDRALRTVPELRILQLGDYTVPATSVQERKGARRRRATAR